MSDPDLPLILGDRATLLKFIDESVDRFIHSLRCFGSVGHDGSTQSLNESIQGGRRKGGNA